MRLIDPETGIVHLPTGEVIGPSMEAPGSGLKYIRSGAKARDVVAQQEPAGGWPFYWSLSFDNSRLSGMHASLVIEKESTTTYDEMSAISKQFHDRMLIDALGDPQMQIPVEVSWFDKLLSKQGAFDWIETLDILKWQLKWGTVTSGFEIRDYEAMIFIVWK